ncbi:MAG TPA: glycosyl hydrolase family 8 [Opitutaceae bacterium]|jgi:oligosaccharide reducing-end xylanase
MRFWRAVLGLLAGVPALGAQQCPNLFHVLLGISQADTDRHLAEVHRQLFHGDPGREAIYYPVGASEAYVADVANRDTRTEGLSYGMMIAVQLDHREEFERIWRFAQDRLLHADGPDQGYFAWHADFSGRQLDPGPAPDGEEWFATALLFASARWQVAAYEESAQQLLHVMIHQHDREGRVATDMFDRKSHLPVFAPGGEGSKFTDASYQLPEFYEIWARRARDPGDRAFYALAAVASRAAWHREANPVTGLMPDYSTFDGVPHARRGHHDQFEYDAWRTLAYPSIDWAWWQVDPWQRAQADRVLHFLDQAGTGADRFKLDGTPLSSTYSAGLWAMAGVAGMAASPEVARPFVRRLWVMSVPDGEYRYYNGVLMMLGLLEAGGRFRVY